MKGHSSKPKIVVSACLLGHNVRYNKGNTNQKWLIRELSKYVDFLPICPEVEMGLGTPREEIQLFENASKSLGLITKKTKIDLTTNANKTYDKITSKFNNQIINGFILMKKSPSCGTSGVKVINKDSNEITKFSPGLFAQNIMNQYPNHPIISSGKLHDFVLRENYLKQIFAHFHFSQLEPSPLSLQNFHQKYKYILMDHSRINLKLLGRIVAESNKENINQQIEKYESLFFKTINCPATRKARYNTLLHLFGYLKKHLSRDEKQLILNHMNQYQSGIVRFISPFSMLKFFFQKFNIEYIYKQLYFAPHPENMAAINEL